MPITSPYTLNLINDVDKDGTSIFIGEFPWNASTSPFKYYTFKYAEGPETTPDFFERIVTTLYAGGQIFISESEMKKVLSLLLLQQGTESSSGIDSISINLVLDESKWNVSTLSNNDDRVNVADFTKNCGIEDSDDPLCAFLRKARGCRSAGISIKPVNGVISGPIKLKLHAANIHGNRIKIEVFEKKSTSESRNIFICTHDIHPHFFRENPGNDKVHSFETHCLKFNLPNDYNKFSYTIKISWLQKNKHGGYQLGKPNRASKKTNEYYFSFGASSDVGREHRHIGWES